MIDPSSQNNSNSRKAVVGNCRLCLAKSVTLQKSHIVPDFLWRDSGVTKGKGFTMWSESHPRLNRRGVQTGLWERLLCSKCEGHFGKLERYAKPMLFGAI